MRRKIISYICLIAMLTDYVPVYALPNATTNVISSESSEEGTESTSEKDENKENTSEEPILEETENKENASEEHTLEETENKENASEEHTLEETENKIGLKDYMFNMYILNEEKVVNNEEELGFSISFDEKESKFIVSNQSEKQLSKENLDTIIYKINIYDKENKEKLNIELLGSDIGNSEKLNILKETKYEIGDSIKISSFDPKNGLKILGDIQGDIDKNKEDYSDGVDNLDYIDNVRFEITENNIKTVYNEAPVFEGLTDLLNVENPNVDVLQGVKVKDDHDGEIDNSKIVVSVQEKTETSAILTYTVQDSWGRSTTGTRKISAMNIDDTAKKTNGGVAYLSEQSDQSIEQNIITVEGIPYIGNITERFKIKFDPISKEIQLYDDDGRFMNNKSKDEYFKFELYDKDMNLKTSVTLLGTDKSDSEKLDAINNFLFEEGDYIGIWHAESDTKLKIGGTVKQTIKNGNNGNGEATLNGQTSNYQNGLPKKEISERRFRIKKTGLEEVTNDAPVIGELEKVTMARGENKDLLEGIASKITDDFDKFDDDSLESEDVSIKHSTFDNTRVGEQIITYTATDKWGKSGTQTRIVEVTSENPLDTTYIEFMGKYNTNNEDNIDNEGNTKSSEANATKSLFKIRIDSVLKQLYVEDLNSIPDEPINPNKASSIFKLKIYTQGGVLQKTLNIKGTDKLRTVLKRINGYKYSETDRIELWSDTPKNIKVIGNITENTGKDPEDYTDGIDDIDYMKNVRFEIGSTNLKYIYNQAPEFTISTELTAERNGTVNLMEGITASDDHDNDLTKKIAHGEIDTRTIGEKYVEYKVVDSWGRSTIIKRKVIVYPYNSLEYNYINVKNNETKETILSIRFDEEHKKFKVNKLDVSKIPSSLNSNDEIFKLELIRNNGTTKTSNDQNVITVTKANLTNNNGSDIVNKINELSYEHDDDISLKVYDPLNGILISGKSQTVLEGFNNEDKMVNSRFKIKPEGLQTTYNEAPVFSGLDDKLYLYKGNNLEENYAKSGITVTDDIDNHIESSSITITNLEEIKTQANEIGEYTLEYQVTDSWGRSASGSRTLAVISKSVSNDIEFYDKTKTNTKLFSLKFNPVKNGFDVIRETTEIPDVEAIKRTSEETTPQNGDNNTTPEEEDNSQTAEPKVFKLGVYNTKGKEVGKFELSEEGINDSNAFSELENITVSDNYYFSVWSDKPSRIKIKGYMTGNDRLGEDDNQREDYSDGIDDKDYMDNVRFKLKTDGLEAVYNKAPKINLPEGTLTEFAGNPIDYLRGVTVSDDYDGVIPTDNVKVDKVENKTENTLEIGDNTVELSVKDSWGRESRINRDINIQNGILKNKIVIYNQHEITEQNKVLEIKFNPESKRLVLLKNDKKFDNGGNNPGYFKIKVERPNDSALETIVQEISFNATEKPYANNKLNNLESYEFEYGDQIVIYHGHPNRFTIDGKVTDSREEYTDGVQNPENLLNTKFEITRSGLKAVYTNPDNDNITDNKNVIGPMAPEKFPFKIQVVPSEKKFKVMNKQNNAILYGDVSIVYKLVHIGSDGTEKLRTELRGSDWASNNKVSEWNERDFEYNDALYIWHKDPKRSIIKGNIKNQREDYSDGVDDPDNMNNVVFKLTETGLESVYNNAPVINGADNIDVYQNTEFNLLQGITITDDFDTGNLREISINGQTVTTNSDGSILTPSNISLSTSVLGAQTITYTATDRWGKTTTVERKITVRPNLYKNIFKIYPDTKATIEPNSDTEPDTEPDNNTDTRKSAFEIGFDSVANKYRVFNQSNDRLSESNPHDIVFGIEIKGSNGTVKSSIELNGNDRGNSDKLEALKSVTYDEGDIIRIYRSNLDAISFEGTVTGDIPTKDQMANEANKFDYMKNTGFEVSNEGLRAKYNKAPVITGVEAEKTITKGIVDLLKGVNVSDELDGDKISTDNITMRINGETVDNKTNYTFNNLGTYKVEYILTDSWGRSTLKESTITVESKVKENSIEVYGPRDTLAFKVIFNTTENKFKLVGTEDSNASTYTSSSDEKGYFEMIVRDIKGKTKYEVTLNGNPEHDRDQLAKIHEKDFTKYDTISLHGHDSNTVKIKGTVISNNSNSNRTNHDYSDGFGTTDKYSQVRFKITDDGLKEITKKDPTILGLEKKTIKRGDEIDFLEGVVVDVKDTNNEDYKIEVKKDSFNNLKENTYTVTYIVTNSWGSRVEKTRQITVEPRNELEKVKLNLTNTSNQNILTIGFDSIQRKLRVLSNVENGFNGLSGSGVVFSISAYDLLGNTLGTIELKGNQSINQDILNRINDFAYIEGYRLSVWVKDLPRINIEGPIKNGTKESINSFTDRDKMENGRFEILENGLKYIYNFAPEIIGGDETIEYYKGTILNIPDSINVADDLDSISKNEVVIDDDQVDYDELGEFPITYVVEDTWGRVATKAGKINIKSAMDSNSIDVYPVRTTTSKSNDKAFSIKFVREDNQNKIKIEDTTDTKLNESAPNEKFMDVVIYGSDGQKKKTVSLLGSDTGNSPKLNGQSGVVEGARTNTEPEEGQESEQNQETGLNDYVYARGDYIALEGITETTKASVKIQGTVVNEKESYTDGIESLDNIHNVRFKFTDLGLESVYNEKPSIRIKEDVKIDGIKGDDIPYMRGVVLSDDHDKLTKDNVEVIWNPNTNGDAGASRTIVGEPRVGENTLQYIVTDSWGRSSDPITRKVNLSNGIFKSHISFDRLGTSESDTGELDIKFTEAANNKVQVNLTGNNQRFWTSDEGGYYKIKVYYPNNTGTTPDINIELKGYDTSTSEKLNQLRNKEIDYGTRFEFYAGHPENFKIKGPVRGAREDYSDGVQNPEYIFNVKFEVTDSGLKSIYTDPDKGQVSGDEHENKNIIALVARESLPLKFKVDPEAKTITRYQYTNTGLQWELGNGTRVFEMILTGANGAEKGRIEGNSRDKGNDERFNITWNFDIGDKLTIWHKTPKRILIKGGVQNAREDYSDGVDNSRNLTEVVFELTENGLKAAYKSAPKLRGAKDYRVEKGSVKTDAHRTELLNYLKEDLRATDDIEGDITPRVEVDDSKLNTDQIGLYEVEYRVTNSNQRITRRSSTVVVYAKPVIKEDNITLELNGSEDNNEAIKEYIKAKLTVTDEEDDRDKQKVKVEVVEQNVNITQGGSYTAKIKATDSDGDITEKVVNVQVTRTINVSVPIAIPFQVVTNLMDKTADPFVSGVMNIKNNNTSDVSVYLESFTRVETTTKTGSYKPLEIVSPTSIADWNTLSEEDSMTKMALGIYNKSGLTVDTGFALTEQKPLWLIENMDEVKLGVLNRATNLKTPYVSSLSFTSKHGKNFIGGTSSGKFNLTFRFE